MRLAKLQLWSSNFGKAPLPPDAVRLPGYGEGPAVGGFLEQGRLKIAKHHSTWCLGELSSKDDCAAGGRAVFPIHPLPPIGGNLKLALVKNKSF